MADDVTRLGDLPTPALVLDLDVLDANLRRMQEKADRLGVALRPHAKTHKCLDVADRQLELGAHGLTVSTLAEARFFAAAGFSDLTWAFPLILDRLDEARRLVEARLMMDADLTLRLTVDSEEAIDALAAQPTPFHVFLKVDCGYGRAGVDPAASTPWRWRGASTRRPTCDSTASSPTPATPTPPPRRTRRGRWRTRSGG